LKDKTWIYFLKLLESFEVKFNFLTIQLQQNLDLDFVVAFCSLLEYWFFYFSMMLQHSKGIIIAPAEVRK